MVVIKLDRLKKIRIKANLTYQEMANQLNISKEYYWMIENGKRRLSYELAVRIANVFNLLPDNIFLDNKLTTCEQDEAGKTCNEITS